MVTKNVTGGVFCNQKGCFGYKVTKWLQKNVTAQAIEMVKQRFKKMGRLQSYIKNMICLENNIYIYQIAYILIGDLAAQNIFLFLGSLCFSKNFVTL